MNTDTYTYIIAYIFIIIYLSICVKEQSLSRNYRIIQTEPFSVSLKCFSYL